MDNAIHASPLPEVDVEELDLDEIEIENLDQELAESRPTLYQRAISAIGEFASISTALRIGGALTIVASMSAFLLQDWVAGDDVSRFYLLLMQTLLFAGGGFGLGFLLKERKGARVFFGLGLLSIAANMTTLGALIFSAVPWNGVFTGLPGFALWQVADINQIGVAGLLAVAVSIPVSLFAYLVLARQSAKSLTVAFLVANSLLLLPVRESWLSGLIILCSLLVPIYYWCRQRKSGTEALTRESVFAIFTLAVPALIIVVRNLLWYRIDELLLITLSLALFIAIREVAGVLKPRLAIQRILNGASVMLALYIAFVFAGYANEFAPSNYFFSLLGAVFALLTLDVTNRSGRDQLMVARLAGAGMVIGSVAQVFLIGGVMSAVFCVLAGVAVITIGKYYKSRSLIVAGAAGIAAGIFQQLYHVVAFVDFGSWASLAVIGVLAIVIGSLLERYGAVLKLKWEQWGEKEHV